MKSKPINLKNLILEQKLPSVQKLETMSLVDIDNLFQSILQKNQQNIMSNEDLSSAKNRRKLDMNKLRLSSWSKLKNHRFSNLSMTDLAGHLMTEPKEVEKYLKELYRWFNENREYYLRQSEIENLDAEIRDELISAKNSDEFNRSIHKYLSKNYDKYWYIWFGLMAVIIGRAILAFSTDGPLP